MDEDAVGLELRFRAREVSTAPPDVEAFLRRPDAGDVLARPEEIAVLKGPQPLVERTPLVVFFQHSGFAIPPVATGDAPIDLGSWSVRPTVFGYLACVPETRRESRRPRTAWVIAACLPLAMPFEVGAAPAEKGSIQRPKTTRPVIPPPSTEAEPTPEPEVAPADPLEGQTPPPTDASETPASETAGDPGDDTPVAPPPPTPAVADPEIVDAAWEGVDGFQVVLRLKGGIDMRGRVGAVQKDTFTLIQHGTGAVLVLPKSGVMSLRAYTPPRIPDRTGTGLLAGGIVMTTVAAPVFISGIAMVAVCPSCTYIHLPLLLIGAGMLAGGIPMTVIGSRRRQRYRRILEEHDVAPIVSRTPHGWSGGLRFRF